MLGDLGLPKSELTRHIAWDIGIAGVAEALSKHLDAHLIAQRYSRLVIDCNRPPAAPSSIPRISEATTIPGNEGLSREAAAARRRAIFDPYHRRIDEIIDQRLRERRPTVLVSLHSFTPVYAGIARPWHIGTLYHRDTRLPPLLLKLLRGEADLVVGDNEPYAVSDETDYTIPVHGEARGLMNSGIEIRQDLIADQAGQQRMGGTAGADFRRDRARWRARLRRMWSERSSDGARQDDGSRRAHHPTLRRSRDRVSASQMPPPIMKPPETRDTSRVRRAEKNERARPASSA